MPHVQPLKFLAPSLLAAGVFFGAILLGGVALGGTALAQPTSVPRVVVLRFEGWRADRAREAVVTEIASYVELVDEERAVAAAAELGVDVSTPEGMQQVVEHLGISVVLAGSVEGRGRRAETTIIVVDSQGNELSRRTGPSPLRGSDGPAIGQAAVEAIEEAQAVLRRQREEAQAVAEPDPALTETADEPVEDAGPDVVGWRQRLLLVMGGLRLRTVGSYVNDVSGYQHFFVSDLYPEIDLFAVVRPLANANDDSRGLLLAAQGSFSVGIAYVDSLNAERGMTSFRFRFDVGYGYTIADIFEIVGTVGFGIEGVSLDGVSLATPAGFPSTLFSYLRPGVTGRLRAYEDLVVVEAGLGGRIGLDGGDLAGAYGTSLFFGGVDVFLGLGGRVEPGFAYAVRFGYTHHALSFSGAGGPYGRGTNGTDEAIDVRLLVGYSM